MFNLDKTDLITVKKPPDSGEPRPINLCKNNGVTVTTLLPHSSSKLQLLDIPLYKSSKNFCNIIIIMSLTEDDNDQQGF